MKTLKNILLSNRFKSFYWRLSMMVVSVVVSALLSEIDMFAPYITPAQMTVLGLLLGELSKYISVKLNERKVLS